MTPPPPDHRRSASRLALARRLGGLLLVAALGVAACSSDPSGDRSTAGSTTATPPTANALLTRLAAEGSDTVFEQRFGGALDQGGETGALVYAGRSGDQAVVYVCDGTAGAWFTGTVASGGAGTLRTADGQASVTLVPVDGGLRTSFTEGDFGGRETTVVPLEIGEGQLVRLEATAEAGGPTAAVGGIIVSPDGVRGLLRTSITDGSANTLILQETATTGIADGQSNTLAFGEGSTTTTANGAPLADGGTDAAGGTSGSRPAPEPTIASPTTTGIADGQSNTLAFGEGSTTTGPIGGGTPRTTTGITDGQSNTLAFGEESTTTTGPIGAGTPRTTIGITTTTGITDGQSNTLAFGEGSTTTTANGAPLADGTTDPTGSTPGTRPVKGTTIVSRTTNGLLTVQIVAASSSTTTTASAAASCATQVATVNELVRSLRTTQAGLVRQLEVLRTQRDAIASQVTNASGADRAAAPKKLDQLNVTIKKVQGQIDQVAAQLDELKRLVATCAGSPAPKSK